ncbi:hypothetical protein MRX96_018012 [Rhipicephalus microplus]
MADIKAESSSPTSDKAKYLHHFEGILVGDMFEESRLRSAFRYEPREEDVYVYALRNPYDTCVSYYHQVQQKAPGCDDLTFDEFFEQFIGGWIHPNDYFDYLASWFAHKARPNFLCIAYEHMKKDPRSGIRKIAAFLGKEISDDALLDEIVQTVSPDIMKRAFAEALSARQQEKSVKGHPPERSFRRLVRRSQQAQRGKPHLEVLWKDANLP